MPGKDSPDNAGARPPEDVCLAVATETVSPPGRVRKVLLAAQRFQQIGHTGPPATTPALPTDPLRFYLFGPFGALCFGALRANGRLHPPLHQPRGADADIPA
jgi:hypothetical protein